jgi:hypothetical protein
LRKAGFTVDNALWILSAREMRPEWMVSAPTIEDIRKHLDEDED